MSASRSSIVRPYFRRTATLRSANQHRFWSGNHSAASRARFWFRFTPGLASVRFSRSVAKRRRVASSATQSPLSCASERGDDMFNVRLPFVGEPAARVGTIDAAKLGDDPVLHRLWIPIVVSIVRGATGFGGNHQAPPRRLGPWRGCATSPWRAQRSIREWGSVAS